MASACGAHSNAVYAPQTSHRAHPIISNIEVTATEVALQALVRLGAVGAAGDGSGRDPQGRFLQVRRVGVQAGAQGQKVEAARSTGLFQRAAVPDGGEAEEPSESRRLAGEPRHGDWLPGCR